MSRPLRIEFENAVYHILARGNEKSPIFRDEADYRRFLEILADMRKRGLICLYAYVLIEDHYHLLLETPEAGLAGIMHEIQTRYTMYFNNRYKRRGHLFQGRYKALLVDKENYLFELSRYIHLNPVRAKISNEPDKYPWSSYGEYASNREGITDKDFMLSQFGQNTRESAVKFREFTEAGREVGKDYLKNNTYGQLIIGTKEFEDEIRKKISKMKVSPEVPALDRAPKENLTEKILTEVGNHFKIPRSELLNRKGRWNEPRKLSIYLIKKYANRQLKDLAKLFGGVHYTAISQMSRRIAEKRKNSRELDETLKYMESKL